MAKIIFKGVPDFTEVRAEIAKLKQEVASVSSTKVNLNGTAQGLNSAANAAGKLAGNLQKVSTTFDANGQATRQVRDFSARLGETTRRGGDAEQGDGGSCCDPADRDPELPTAGPSGGESRCRGTESHPAGQRHLQQQSRAAQNTPL